MTHSSPFGARGDEDAALGRGAGEHTFIVHAGRLGMDPGDVVALAAKALDGRSREVLVREQLHQSAERG